MNCGGLFQHNVRERVRAKVRSNENKLEKPESTIGNKRWPIFDAVSLANRNKPVPRIFRNISADKIRYLNVPGFYYFVGVTISASESPYRIANENIKHLIWIMINKQLLPNPL